MSGGVTPKVTFTFDLEDHRADRSRPRRYPDATRPVLAWLAERSIRGTFFTVGDVASQEPGLLRDIVDAGHEIACHSLDHTVLTRQDEATFRDHSARAKSLLEDATGQAVTGYRAPVFSLTPAVPWVPDVLAELGYAYSSSTLPSRHPLHGFPGLPLSPFRWESGLLELPAPVSQAGSVLGSDRKLPYLGGIYLRYLPERFIAWSLRQASEQQGLWTYSHPYDYDTREPFGRIAGASLPVSIILWLNRSVTLRRMAMLDAMVAWDAPFAEQMSEGRFADAPLYTIAR